MAAEDEEEEEADDEATQVPPSYEVPSLEGEDEEQKGADAGLTPAEAALLAHLREARSCPDLAPQDLWPKVRRSMILVVLDSFFPSSVPVMDRCSPTFSFDH